MVQSGYVEVKSVPTRVVSAGGWMQDAFEKRKELVFIITGKYKLQFYFCSSYKSSKNIFLTFVYFH